MSTIEEIDSLEELARRRAELTIAMKFNRDDVSGLEDKYARMLKQYRQMEIQELNLRREAAKIVPTDILK